MRGRQHITLADQNAAARVKFRSVRCAADIGKEPKPMIRTTMGLGVRLGEFPLTFGVLNECQPWILLDLRLCSVAQLPLDGPALGGQQRMLEGP